MPGFRKGNLLKITQRRTKDDPRIYASGEVGCFQLSLPKITRHRTKDGPRIYSSGEVGLAHLRGCR